MGLTATEWYILESAALPDPCDDETECSDYDAEQSAAQSNLVTRGLVVIVPCVYDPVDDHPALTPTGRLLLGLDRRLSSLA